MQHCYTLCQGVDKKSNHEMFNFGNWFPCLLSPNTWYFWMRHIFTCPSFFTVRSAQDTLQVIRALQLPHVVDTDLLPTIVIGGPAQNTHKTPVTRFISSVRSSYSHPDLILTHPTPTHPTSPHPTFSDHTGPQHWTFTFWATTDI